MLRPDELPFTNPAGAVYDSGDYARCLRMAADAIGYDGAARRGARAARGRALPGHRPVVLRGAHRLRERRSSWPPAARASAPTRASRCAPTAPAASTSTPACPAFGPEPRDDLRAGLQRTSSASRYERASACTSATPRATPLNTGAFASRTMIAAAGAIERAGRHAAREDAAHRGRAILDVADPETWRSPGEALCGATTRPRAFRSPGCSSIAIIGQGLPPGERARPRGHGTLRAAGGGLSLRQRGRGRRGRPARPATSTIERFVIVHDCGTVGQPDDRRRPGAGRARPGLRRGAVRGAALRPRARASWSTARCSTTSCPTACDLPPVELLHTDGALAGHPLRRPRRRRGRDDPAGRRASRTPSATRWPTSASS